MSDQGTPTDPRVAAIIRRGSLRIGLFPSFFYRREPDGAFAGWGIEMGRALADKMGVAVQFIERANPPVVVASLQAGACDTAFLGISAERAAEVDFTPPWAQADFTFLVPAASAVGSIADADRTGIRIGVVRHHAMDTALHGKLKLAQRVYADTPDAAFELFQQGAADVLAGIRPGLNAYAAKAPGTRVLADKYGTNVIGLAVVKGDADWIAYVSAFVADSKRSGTARAAADRSGTRGLEIAP